MTYLVSIDRFTTTSNDEFVDIADAKRAVLVAQRPDVKRVLLTSWDDRNEYTILSVWGEPLPS